jgi:hypothetical protein
MSIPPSLAPYYHSILLRGTDLWPSFHGKTVFIAGGHGFYGGWFTGFFGYLREQGIDVTVRAASRATGFNVLHLDSYPAILSQADYVINACGPSEDDGDHSLVYDEGAFLLHRFTKPSSRYLLISTGAIRANTGYAKAKARAEWLLDAHRGQVQIVRPFATVGPNMALDRHFAISTFIKRAKAGLPLEVEDRFITRSFCHVADLVIQSLHVLIAGDGQPYEVGSDDEIDLERAARVISTNVKRVSTQFYTSADSDRYVADLTRVRSHFNLDIEWTSERAIRDAAVYHGVSVP